MRRVLVVLGVAAASLALNPAPPSASAQWWAGTSTACSAPYNYEGSGYLLSSCQSGAGYSGWGYGGAYGGLGASQYVTGGWAGWPQSYTTRTDAWGAAAYTPWGWGYSYCRSWWGC